MEVTCGAIAASPSAASAASSLIDAASWWTVLRHSRWKRDLVTDMMAARRVLMDDALVAHEVGGRVGR